MNKKHLLLIPCCTAILTVVLCIEGCAILAPEDQYYEYKVPDKKLHTITPIEPNQFTAPKPAPAKEQTPDAKAEMKAEPNLPPLVEIKMPLEECRALTLQNNLELQATLIDPAIAAESVNFQEAKFESTFYASTSFANLDQPGRGNKLSGAEQSTGFGSSQAHNISSIAGVKMPLQTGGTLDFSLGDERAHTLGGDPQFSTNFSFSVSQPLLKNAGQRVTMRSILLARYDKQITDTTTQLAVIRVLATADRSYWRLYAARKELEVRQEQHKLAVAQLDRAKRMVNAGQMANIEIVRAEAGVARQLAAIITAENSLRNRQREFKLVINKPGLDIETQTIVIPTTEADPVHYTFDMSKLVDQAFENRAELLELELRLAKDVSDIDFYNNQMLPLITLDYTYNVPGVGPNRNDAYDMLGRKNFDNHTLNLTISMPLGNEQAKSNLRQVMYIKRQRLATKAKQRQSVKQEVLNALDTAEANWQQIMASRQDALLEGELYRAEVRQFEVGLRTSTDVLDAQTKLADAQSAEITALVNYEISLVDMAYATGTLLGADKIQWQATTPIVPVK